MWDFFHEAIPNSPRHHIFFIVPFGSILILLSYARKNQRLGSSCPNTFFKTMRKSQFDSWSYLLLFFCIQPVCVWVVTTKIPKLRGAVWLSTRASEWAHGRCETPGPEKEEEGERSQAADLNCVCSRSSRRTEQLSLCLLVSLHTNTPAYLSRPLSSSVSPSTAD